MDKDPDFSFCQTITFLKGLTYVLFQTQILYSVLKMHCVFIFSEHSNPEEQQAYK